MMRERVASCPEGLCQRLFGADIFIFIHLSSGEATFLANPLGN